MARFLHRVSSSRRCNSATLFLAFFWIVGILFGIGISFWSEGLYSSLMRSFRFDSVSIVGLTGITFLPFLLSALAVSISGHWLLYPIVFFKGVLFSLISMSIFLCYGHAGWLIRLFLCFSDVVSLPLLFFFWLRLLDRNYFNGIRDAFLFLGPVYCIGSIDLCLILPFFAGLINSIER